MPADHSNGYDAAADEFTEARSPVIGVEAVSSWLASLTAGGSILDIGAGNGAPLTSTIVNAGFDVYAIEASEALVAEFRRRLPGVTIACEPAETSALFDRMFDGILAVGLVFLLPESDQRALIEKGANALRPGGGLLFSAPIETGTWDDILTGLPSTSLGEEAYRTVMSACGLRPVETCLDEGGTNYYTALKR